MHPETLAVRGIDANDPTTGAIIPPIQLATTYERDADYNLLANRDYTRDKNPTYAHAERLLAALEGGHEAQLFASGMAAATTTIRAAIRTGDHVVAPKVSYFAIRAWLTHMSERFGINVTFVDTTSLDEVAAAMRPGQTKMVWFETPANPTWDVTDIAGVVDIAHRVGAAVCVDSTAATPVHTKPLAFGADLVMHSATKYLNGHSDVLAGAIVTQADSPLWQAIRTLRREEGAVLGAMEAWLLLRGMRTLFPRVERSSATAMTLAHRLAELPGVTVRYPGLPSHPHHAIATRQMTNGFGGMLSIQTGGGAERALATIKKLELWICATSLGGVESLVEHRASVEGPNTPTPPDLLRLSVGLEHPDDLFDDLKQALNDR